MEQVIIRVKVQYDALSRTLTLVDPEFSASIEGAGVCELSLPVLMYDEAEVQELISTGSAAVAHG
jgi:hypothetical protein